MPGYTCGLRGIKGFALVTILFSTAVWGQVTDPENNAVACVTPVGFDDDSPNSLSSADFAQRIAGGPGMTEALFSVMNPVLARDFEVPIQARIRQLLSLVMYNAASAFHPRALNHFGMRRVSQKLRRCVNSKHADLHRAVSTAYGFYILTEEIAPQLQTPLMRALEYFGLDPNLCKSSREACRNSRTPWGFGRLLARDVIRFSRNDGWNGDGRESQVANRVPYQDWRADPYAPKCNVEEDVLDMAWQPLLESDRDGFLLNQLHVTPHIGQTGVSLLVGDEEMCLHQASSPEYNLALEVELVLNRTKAMAESDHTKTEVEFFDNKFSSLIPLVAQYLLRQGNLRESFEFTKVESMIYNVIYESILLSWKEKVRYDVARPTTIVHRMLGGRTVVSYAGPNQGARAIPANNWEPYMRSMPYSEYPSASSCICKAVATAMREYSGSDKIQVPANLATNQPKDILVSIIPRGSSRVEPGFTPAHTIELQYRKWSEIAEACSQSRLSGGMHFTAAIKAGEDLCTPLGSKIVKAFGDLERGVVPDYVSANRPEPKEIRCGKVSPNPRINQ